MPTAATIRPTLRIVTLITFVAVGTNLTGCAHLATFYNGLLLRCQTKHDLADIRQDTRQELNAQLQESQRLAAQREVEQARLNAERMRLEGELCQARQEALQEQVRQNLRNVLESKVAFNVEHGLEVGELEVDTEALQELLKERAQPRPTAPFLEGKPPCACCDQPCRCGSGFLRRFCPHCRHKPCEAEQKCGGPEAFAELQRAPLRQPLRPAEIPMKLPVRLTYGFQQPVIEQPRVRRLPVTGPPSPFREVPCTEGAAPCPYGVCPQPGQQGFAPPQLPGPAGGLPPREGGSDQPGPAGSSQPPKPIPEIEARQSPPPVLPSPGIRLGAAPSVAPNFTWRLANIFDHPLTGQR